MLEELLIDRRADVEQQQRDRREHQNDVHVTGHFAGFLGDAGHDRNGTPPTSGVNQLFAPSETAIRPVSGSRISAT